MESNSTDERIWENINTHFEPDASHSSRECMNSNVDKLGHLLGIKNISNEVSEDFLKNASYLLDEMFFALIECPSAYERLYKKTIYGPQSRLIMLASNIIKKSPNNFKLKAKKIFSKISSMIFQKYHNGSVKSKDNIVTLNCKIN